MSDPRGHLRPVGDLDAEMMRLARERQVTGGQVCAAQDRCTAGCEGGLPHCGQAHRLPSARTHDSAHCDRVWGGSR
jgi:hypothetical protein